MLNFLRKTAVMIPMEVLPPMPTKILTNINAMKLASGLYHHHIAAAPRDNNELFKQAEAIALRVSLSLDRSNAASPARPPSRNVTTRIQ